MHSRKRSISTSFTLLFDWLCSGKVLVLLSCLLVGCAGLSEVTPLDVDVRARHLLETTLDNPEVDKALQSFGIPHQANAPWTLDQLTIAAWELRPEIKVARAEIKAALAAPPAM